ncbi:hypothetical protein BsIDN1_62400 [Bacillus safensis]|uniref:Uncharacterized protein n=1 Tax=Bacillus safensis TaxID=561879 RepID=A0A5S9MJ00_BACIA|nr:hypothetical protein BsIDN1_62400 [Bacillus safensis]
MFLLRRFAHVKKAISRIFELFDEDASRGVPMRATLIHGNREEEAEELIAHLSEKKISSC